MSEMPRQRPMGAGWRTEEVRSVTDKLVAPMGKEIRLTEYAACAG